MSSKFRLVVAIAFVAVLAAGTLQLLAPAAHAQPNPQPQDCICSPGINIGTPDRPVTIKQCQCGILTCAVMVESGQLQCSR